MPFVSIEQMLLRLKAVFHNAVKIVLGYTDKNDVGEM